jgi:hypothetical protein
LRNAHCLDCAAAFAGLLLMAAPALAEPGDAEAVARARHDYAQAMKGHDAGLQNAMRAELAAQLSLSRQRAKGRHPSRHAAEAHRRSPDS